MGSPWNNPSVPRRAVLVWGGGSPCGVSDSRRAVRFNGPGVFPGVSPGAGRPGGAGPGFAFDGRSPSGSGPAGRAATAGPAGLLVPMAGAWSCFSDLPLEPFGVDPRPGHGAGGKRRGERQVFPVPLEKGIDLIVLGLCPKRESCRPGTGLLFLFVKPHPEGGLEGDGEGGNCRFHLGSSFWVPMGKGQPRRQVTDGRAASGLPTGMCFYPHTGIIAGFPCRCKLLARGGDRGLRRQRRKRRKKTAGFCGKERLDGAGGKCYDTNKLKIPNQ